MGKNASCDRLLHREVRANRSNVVVGVLRIRYSQNDYIIFSQSLPSFRSISDLIKAEVFRRQSRGYEKCSGGTGFVTLP